MAEVVHSAHYGSAPFVAAFAPKPLPELGHGLAGPPARERRNPSAGPLSPGGARAAWNGGPGVASHAGMIYDAVPISGLRHKSLGPFAGAADADLARHLAQEGAGLAAARKSVRGVVGGEADKAAAVRAAERAIRPWSAIVGLGERRGAKFGEMVARSPQSLRRPDVGPDAAPALFQLPLTEAAEAVGVAAGRAARPGTAQVGAPGAYSPVPGHPARELWPNDIRDPPKYCAGCREDHHEAWKEDARVWEPYTPQMRLAGLNALRSKFADALMKGQLCVALNDDSRVEPVRWTWRVRDGDGDEVLAQPSNLSPPDFSRQLALMFDGLREGHEPWRHLATQAATAFMDTRSPHLVTAVPSLVTPIRLGLQTYEPSLVGHMLLMVQRLVRSHPGVAPALVPHLKVLLPPVALLRRKRFVVRLPPPFCVGAAGSFTGSGEAPETGARACPVCRAPLDKVAAASVAAARAAAAARDNPHLLTEPVPPEYHRNPLKGRWSEKHELRQVIDDTLDLLVERGGAPALAAVRKSVPTYHLCNPR